MLPCKYCSKAPPTLQIWVITVEELLYTHTCALTHTHINNQMLPSPTSSQITDYIPTTWVNRFVWDPPSPWQRRSGFHPQRALCCHEAPAGLPTSEPASALCQSGKHPPALRWDGHFQEGQEAITSEAPQSKRRTWSLKWTLWISWLHLASLLHIRGHLGF